MDYAFFRICSYKNDIQYLYPLPDSSLRSRMTGRYLIPFCKKLFYVSAHTCPFRRLRRHLPRVRGRLFYVRHFVIFRFCSFIIYFYVSTHTLLQRRFSPRKVVHLPSLRSRMTMQVFNAVEKRNSPLPSFLSGRQNRNDDGRKNIM